MHMISHVHTHAFMYIHVHSYTDMQSLQRVDMVRGGSRPRNNTISGPAYATVGPKFHHVAAKNFGSTGNLDSHQGISRRRSLGQVHVHVHTTGVCIKVCTCVCTCM